MFSEKVIFLSELTLVSFLITSLFLSQETEQILPYQELIGDFQEYLSVWPLEALTDPSFFSLTAFFP